MFRTAANRAKLTVGADILTVHRGGNGRRYRVDLTGAHRAFRQVDGGGAGRNQLKRIINGDEAEARKLLADMSPNYGWLTEWDGGWLIRKDEASARQAGLDAGIPEAEFHTIPNVP